MTQPDMPTTLDPQTRPTAEPGTGPGTGPGTEPDVDAGPKGHDRAMAKLGWWQRTRIALKRLTTRSWFWHNALTMVFMPALWRSGIRLRLMPDHFQGVLPFNRYNRNFDGDIAGAALLGNCEVAAGGYIFYAAEGTYSVVCKHLAFKFRRPCRAAVEYRVALNEQLAPLLATLRPFTMELAVEVFELGEIRRQVGTAVATFHARPIGYMRSRDRQRQDPGTPAPP